MWIGNTDVEACATQHANGLEDLVTDAGYSYDDVVEAYIAGFEKAEVVAQEVVAKMAQGIMETLVVHPS